MVAVDRLDVDVGFVDDVLPGDATVVGCPVAAGPASPGTARISIEPSPRCARTATVFVGRARPPVAVGSATVDTSPRTMASTVALGVGWGSGGSPGSRPLPQLTIAASTNRDTSVKPATPCSSLTVEACPGRLGLEDAAE